MENGSDVRKINIDTNTLVVLYSHYKEFFLPVGIILISILLFFLFVIPGIQNYFSVQSLAKSETQKLVILKTNLNTLSGIDDNQLNQNLAVLSTALPSGKDFAGVINAIDADAALTGVSVGDFEFSVGNLSNSFNQQAGSYPTILLTLSLGGSVNSTLNFMQQLAKTVPLSEITDVKINAESANIIIQFYFKPFLSSNVSDETPVSPLTAKDLALISQISKWNNSAPLGLAPTLSSPSPAATESAVTGTNPYPF